MNTRELLSSLPQTQAQILAPTSDLRQDEVTFLLKLNEVEYLLHQGPAGHLSVMTDSQEIKSRVAV